MPKITLHNVNYLVPNINISPVVNHDLQSWELKGYELEVCLKSLKNNHIIFKFIRRAIENNWKISYEELMSDMNFWKITLINMWHALWQKKRETQKLLEDFSVMQVTIKGKLIGLSSTGAEELILEGVGRRERKTHFSE
jgi:hypothetical protein